MLESALLCLALNIYHEARGEPPAGQAAVAQVTLNRAAEKNRSVCKVVFRPKQFSWTNDHVIYDAKGNVLQLKQSAKPEEAEAWDRAIRIASKALRGLIRVDSVGRATHYHTPEVKPGWRKEGIKLTQIGQHIFYKRIRY